MMRNWTRHVLMVAVVIAGSVLAQASRAQAEPFVYEPFDYPAGENLDGKTAQGLLPWTDGDAAIIRGGSKTYTDGDGQELVIDGNYMEFQGSGLGMNIDVSLWPESHKTQVEPGVWELGAPGAEIWMSYIRKASSVPPDPNYWFEDVIIGARLQIGRYYWQQTLSAIWNQPPSDPTDAIASDEHFVLLRHKTNPAGNTVVDMWVDPPLMNEAGLPDLNDSPEGDFQSTSAVINGGHTFDSWRFRKGGGPTYFIDYDEIRIGTSYADVAVPEPLRSVSAVDIAAEFTPGGGDHGLGELTAGGAADVVVEDPDGLQTTYAGGSFEMTASLLADNSADGLAEGEFSGGELAFRDSGGDDLLAGDLIELLLYEVGDDMGMIAGSGLFEVTGGSLQGDFVRTHGEIFQMFFQVTPSNIDNFAAAFTGFTNITITPIPEPSSAILLWIGLGAAVRRRRK